MSETERSDIYEIRSLLPDSGDIEVTTRARAILRVDSIHRSKWHVPPLSVAVPPSTSRVATNRTLELCAALSDATAKLHYAAPAARRPVLAGLTGVCCFITPDTRERMSRLQRAAGLKLCCCRPAAMLAAPDAGFDDAHCFEALDTSVDHDVENAHAAPGSPHTGLPA